MKPFPNLNSDIHSNSDCKCLQCISSRVFHIYRCFQHSSAIHLQLSTPFTDLWLSGLSRNISRAVFKAFEGWGQSIDFRSINRVKQQLTDHKCKMAVFMKKKKQWRWQICSTYKIIVDIMKVIRWTGLRLKCYNWVQRFLNQFFKLKLSVFLLHSYSWVNDLINQSQTKDLFHIIAVRKYHRLSWENNNKIKHPEYCDVLHMQNENSKYEKKGSILNCPISVSQKLSKQFHKKSFILSPSCKNYSDDYALTGYTFYDQTNNCHLCHCDRAQYLWIQILIYEN